MFAVKPLWLPDITIAAESSVLQHTHTFNIAVRNWNKIKASICSDL
jgi:hypothetical protein